MPRPARKDLDKIQDRRAEVVRLRGEGKTWDEIARLTGYSNGSAASKAWKVAIQQHPDQSVDEVRRQEKTRLEAMDAALAGIIASPPAKTTAIGKTVVDPDTGEIVRDQQVVVSSIRARLAVGESYRKLVGADAPAASTVTVTDNSTRILADVKQFYADHPGYRRTPGSTVPPGIEVRGPAAIAAWTANQAHHARLAAGPASHADTGIVDAEIIEDETP